MHRVTVPLSLAFSTILAACGRNEARGLALDSTAIRDSVRAAVDGMLAAANRLDVDGMFSVTSNSPNAAGIDGATLFPTMDSLRGVIRQNYGPLRSSEATVLTSRVTPLDNGLALYFGIVRWTQIDTTGQRIVAPAGVTMLFRREPSGWRVIHLHESGWCRRGYEGTIVRMYGGELAPLPPNKGLEQSRPPAIQALGVWLVRPRSSSPERYASTGAAAPGALGHPPGPWTCP